VGGGKKDPTGFSSERGGDPIRRIKERTRRGLAFKGKRWKRGQIY